MSVTTASTAPRSTTLRTSDNRAGGGLGLPTAAKVAVGAALNATADMGSAEHAATHHHR